MRRVCGVSGRIRKEEVNTLAPILLQCAECVLRANSDVEVSSCVLHHLIQLTSICACYQNNLMIDSIVQLLVEQTGLLIHPLVYSAPVNPPSPDASTVSLLIRLESDKEEFSSRNEKRLLYLYYSPLLHITQFGSSTESESGTFSLPTECFKTVMNIIQDYGSSIQKGYNDVVCPNSGYDPLVFDGCDALLHWSRRSQNSLYFYHS